MTTFTVTGKTLVGEIVNNYPETAWAAPLPKRNRWKTPAPYMALIPSL